jgi:hypothetical protein
MWLTLIEQPAGGDRFLCYARSPDGRLWSRDAGNGAPWQPMMGPGEEQCPRCAGRKRNGYPCGLCLDVGFLDEEGLPPDDLRYLTNLPSDDTAAVFLVG